MDNVLALAESGLKLAGQHLTGWDGGIALLIVLFTEYVIKWLFKKSKKEVYDVIVKLSPICISAITYVVIAICQKTGWVTGLLHGLFVGLGAIGSYDVILKKGIAWLKNLWEMLKSVFTKTTGDVIESAKGINEEIKKDME